MQILIFRHGEKQKRINSLNTEENRSICLSEKGIQQIEELSREIHDTLPEFIGLKQIYSSTFPRTIQSAEIVRHILSIKVIRSNIVFKELYAFESYSLQKEKQRELHRYALENLGYITSCGYSFGDRAIEALNFIKVLYPNQDICTCRTHKGNPFDYR